MHVARPHIDQLEHKITDLALALAQLAESRELHELQRLIHFPGWTTPAELGFVHSLLDAMLSQAALLRRLQGELLQNGRKVAPRD
ncbi:hypothetical protein [Massilia sp. TS11]|uniref:hypothetical protein n=1 Tax=Massilia sp. TS11 TaxID=2908003 RepID=UPI001EDA418D|nr:hypothetical protein [Massilia sp. TS11]MCG2586254.1 hypothetical protein [Massilia sp. TS11]